VDEAWQLIERIAGRVLGDVVAADPATRRLQRGGGDVVVLGPLLDRLASSHPPSEWEAEIAGHLAAVAGAGAAIASIATSFWPAMRPLLKWRLRRRRRSDEIGRPLDPRGEMLLSVALDTLAGAVPVLERDLTRWQQTSSQVLAVAASNTRCQPAWARGVAVDTPIGATDLWLLRGGPFTTGLAADLDRLVPSTALALAPDDHLLLVAAPSATTAAGPSGDQLLALARWLRHHGGRRATGRWRDGTVFRFGEAGRLTVFEPSVNPGH
jgi:hypothetical protein